MRILILPLLIPFLTAILLALCNGWRRTEKVVSLLSCLGLTGFVFWLLFYVDNHGIQSTVIGGWTAPYGIALVADRLTAIMLCLSMGVGTLVLFYTFFTVTETQQKYFFYPFFQIILLGVNWSFITGDLFNLFVGYEVMLIGSYGMMMVGASRAQVRQTMKYIAINAIGSTFFVAGIGLLYATVGTLNMADLSQRTALITGDRAALVTAVSMMLMVVFAMKSAAFPVFFWLPDSYPIVPAGVIGFFAGLLTKVGVYSLLRVFLVVFRQDGHQFATHTLLVLSGFTMVLGVMGAMCQWEIRKILSWHIISQVGYMVMGVGLASSSNPVVSRLAIAGTIFYIVHHIVVKSSLFLIGGIAEQVVGTQELKKMGGLLDLSPVSAGMFLIAAFSLAGMPPFSGFLSKFVLIRAAVEGHNWVILAAALVTSFLTLYSMSKIWAYSFWGHKVRETPAHGYRWLMAPTAVLVLFTVGMGLFGQPFLRLAGDAADEILNPTAYINSVMQPVGETVSATGHARLIDAKPQALMVTQVLVSATGEAPR